MGYLARDVCHATQEAAAAAACAAYPMPSANGMTVCQGVQPGGGAIVVVPAGGSASAAYPLAFGTCDEQMPFADMSGLFTAFLGACAVVWAVKNLVAKHVTGNH